MKMFHVRITASSFVALAFSLLCFPGSAASAQSGRPRVLVSNAMKAVMEELRPKCEQAIGGPLEIQYETSKVLGKAISGGQAFDVVILNPEFMNAVAKDGKIVSGSRVDIARATFGVGLRAGTPQPEIATAAAMKRTLLQARKITFPNEGASTPFILKMFDRLGIADQLKSKSLPEPVTAAALADVLEGRADLVITLSSEILPAKGIEFAGPAPDEFQGDLIFSAAVGAKSENVAAAQALLKYLGSPAIAPTLRANGMETVKK